MQLFLGGNYAGVHGSTAVTCCPCCKVEVGLRITMREGTYSKRPCMVRCVVAAQDAERGKHASLSGLLAELQAKHAARSDQEALSHQVGFVAVSLAVTACQLCELGLLIECWYIWQNTCLCLLYRLASCKNCPIFWQVTSTRLLMANSLGSLPLKLAQPLPFSCSARCHSGRLQPPAFLVMQITLLKEDNNKLREKNRVLEEELLRAGNYSHPSSD